MMDVANAADRNTAHETVAFEPPVIVDYGDVAKETRSDQGAGTYDGFGYS
ncbi:hypothetical protein ABIE65_004502 [Constrictibacter sp. MBR-5]|jgi:hypothetical protein